MAGVDKVSEASLETGRRGRNPALFVALGLGLALAVVLILRWKRRRSNLFATDEAEPPVGGSTPPEARQDQHFNRRTARLAGSGLVIGLALVLGVAVLLGVYFAVMVTPEEAVFPPFMQADRAATPRPRVAALAETLQDVQATEQARLEGYDWVDQEAGIARIPIQRAMQLLAEQASQSANRPP